MSKLSGKRILVTGANRGLGLEMVKQLLRKYNPEKIFATCRNPDQADALKIIGQDESRIHILKIDVTNIKSFPRAVEQVHALTNGSGINVLINNAGIFRFESQSLEHISEEMMLEFYQVNTLGPLFLTKTFMPLLVAASQATKEPGVVVNFASRIGSIADNTSGGLYASRCSRSATNAATKSMSLDLKEKNILAVGMNPGWVKTDQGGSDAKLGVEESVSSFLNVLDNLTEGQNGRLVQYDGEILEW